MMFCPLRLLSLPVEIVCHILNFLDTQDLIRCTLVAKDTRKLISDSSKLQYAIELAKYRMISILPSSDKMPYSLRLKILRERERAWGKLSWNGRHQLKLPPTGSVYEFVGGFYGNGREDDHKVTASISFLELPSSESPSVPSSDLKTWTHPMLDVTIIDFTMDPSQDLLVLIALAAPGSGYVYELHLRTLSTNQPHLKAALPILPCLVKPSHLPQNSDLIAAVRVQVSGPLVALLIKEVHDSTGAHLELWDWLNNPYHSCKMARITGIDDFTFLSQEAFLLVRPTGNFEVYTFENPITPSTTPVCQASYAFPPLAEGYMYWYITMSSNPAPGSLPRLSTKTNPPLGGGQQIYYPKPDERIHACCLYIFNPSNDENHDHRVHCFVFFVNLRTLLHPRPEWLKWPSQTRAPGFSRQASDMNTKVPTSSQLVEPGTPISTPSSTPPALPTGMSPPSPPHSASEPLTSSPQSQLHSQSVSFALLSSILSLPSPFSSPSLPSTSLPPTDGFPTHIPVQMPTHIPWAAWGPQSTRWFQECLSTDWQHSIYGLRTVESVTMEKMGRSTLFAPVFPPRRTRSGARPGGPESNGIANGGGSSVTQSVSSANIGTGSAAVANRNASATNGNPNTNAVNTVGNVNNNENRESSNQRRFIRMRNYNPYAVMRCLEEQGGNKRKGKHKANWNEPRVVSDPSTTLVKGVFKHDIVSCLPYVEVVSEEMFEVTDVMMDDCRLLLLRRGDNGRLRRVDVLTM